MTDTENTSKLSPEEVQRIADLTHMILGIGLNMDTHLTKQAAAELRQEANRYDSIAAINPGWSPEGSRLIREKANIMEHLALAFEGHREVMKLASKIRVHQDFTENLNRQFLGITHNQ